MCRADRIAQGRDGQTFNRPMRVVPTDASSRGVTSCIASASGVLLCVYPYFTDHLFWLSVIGLALLAPPFVIEA